MVELHGKLEFIVLAPGVGRITMHPLVAWRLMKGSFALRGEVLSKRLERTQRIAGGHARADYGSATLHLGPQGRVPRTPITGNAYLNSDGSIRRASQDGPRLCAGP